MSFSHSIKSHFLNRVQLSQLSPWMGPYSLGLNRVDYNVENSVVPNTHHWRTILHWPKVQSINQWFISFCSTSTGLHSEKQIQIQNTHEIQNTEKYDSSVIRVQRLCVVIQAVRCERFSDLFVLALCVCKGLGFLRLSIVSLSPLSG